MSGWGAGIERRIRIVMGAALVVGLLSPSGCARMPYTTKVLHDDQRVRVTAQRELEPAGYTHPVQLSPADLANILRGFSIREAQRLPLRWFEEEVPPRPLLRADEISVLASALAMALTKVSPDERVHFEVIAPGMNPAMLKDVVAGWVAVRDPHFHIVPEYFHTQIPTHKSDPYDYNYPTPPPPPRDYLLYFEPGRFWVESGKGRRALDYRQFLKTVPMTDR